MSRSLAVALTIGALAWSVLIVVGPVAIRSSVAVRPTSFLYAGCSRICHQRPERSFAIAGVQMPVCARCSGLYISGAAGSLVAWRRWRRSPRMTPAALLALAALPTAVTFALEFAGILPFSNTARAFAALPLGACAGWVFVSMLRYDSRLDGLKNADR